MGMPWVRAASKIVVPCATDTGVPSMINSTSFAAGLMIFSALTEANPSRTVAANNMVFHHTREMFHHRGDRNRHYLPKSTNGCLPHGQRKFVHDLHVVFGASPFGPAFEHLDHLLRTHPAGHAFATRLIAVEASGVERHVQHASAFGANDDCS